MERYELRSKNNHVLLLLEAESIQDARLYGMRNVPAFDRAVALPEGDGGLEESIRAAYPDFTDEQVRIFATGRPEEARIIKVGEQDSNPIFQRGEKDAEKEIAAEIRSWETKRSAEAAARDKAIKENKLAAARRSERPLIEVELREKAEAAAEAEEGEPDADRMQLEESWRAAHPDWTDEQIRVAVEG